MPNSLQDIDFYGGFWWRFDHYEINDGYIRPAEGANLERYDPWKANHDTPALYEPTLVLADELERGSIQRKKRLDELYDALVMDAPDIEKKLAEIGRELAATLPSSVQIQLLDWCAEFGLPGILLHRVQHVTFAAQWEKQSEKSLADNLVAISRTYYRANDGWRESRSNLRMSLPFDSSPTLGDTVTREEFGGAVPRPLVLARDMRSVRYEEENIGFWERFFPSVLSQARPRPIPPHPLSEDFWLSYAEPLPDFINALVSFRNAVIGASAWKEGKNNAGEARAHMEWLNAQTFGVSPFAAPVPDASIEMQWVSPSLIASLSTMVLQDLSEQLRVLRCENCRKPFVTKAYQARYCGDTCKWAVNKRTQRENRKA